MSEDAHPEPPQGSTPRLDAHEKTLILLRDELYGGSWDELVADLEARHQSKPFVFKLSSRIEEDLERITRLRAYETRGVDLATLLCETTEAEEKTMKHVLLSATVTGVALLVVGCLGENRESPTGPQAIQRVDSGLRGERPQIDKERVKAFGFQVHWDSHIRDEVITSVNIEGDQLYAFTDSKRLYQVDMQSGMINWVYDVGKPLSFTDTSPICEWTYEADKDTKYKEYDEIFFIADDTLVGLDKKNGSELFTVNLSFTPSAPPRASSTHLFVGSWDDRIYGIRKDNPTVTDWFWRSDGDVRTRPAYDSPTAFVTSRDGTMYTFDAATGRRKWEFKTDKQLTQDALIFTSLLYLPSDDYNLYVLDVSDGLLHYRTCVGAPITTSPVAIDKTIYFAAGAEGMHALLRKGRPEASKGNPRKTEHELIWQRKQAQKILCKGSQDVYVLEPGEGAGNYSVARLDAKDGHFRDSLPLSGVDFWITNSLSPADPTRARSIRGGTIILGFRSGWIVGLKEIATIPGA